MPSTGKIAWEDSKRKRCEKYYTVNTHQLTFFHVFGLPHLFVHTLSALTPHSPRYILYSSAPPKNNLTFLVLTRNVLPSLGYPSSVCNADLASRNMPLCLVLSFLYAHTFYFLSQRINSWKTRIISYTFIQTLSSLVAYDLRLNNMYSLELLVKMHYWTWQKVGQEHIFFTFTNSLCFYWDSWK